MTLATWSLFILASVAHAKNPQAVQVLPASFAVLGQNGTFRATGFDMFNPTNNTPPFFQVFDSDFYDIISSHSKLFSVSSDPTFAFAHEAPVWVPESDEVWFCSNGGGGLGRSGIDANNQVAKISLKAVAAAVKANGTGSVNVTHAKVELADSMQMTNGGTGPYKGQIIFMNQGRGALPANMALVDPKTNNVTTLLDNFYGRQFNALNDVRVHPSGQIFFTDVPYGYYQNFKPEPTIPAQVYRFDPKTKAVRVVADGFNKPNGLTFTPDYKSVYVADTGALGAKWANNGTLPATIYKFDVTPGTLEFVNRRVFAYVDTGAADGVVVDTKGNVYGGCGDGVHVWNSHGVLLGKFYVGGNSANMAFASDGRLVILAETAIYMASGLKVEGMNMEVITK
ncbi:D-lactonohydrolase-like protein [Roridomyces roridus]|uniref:D-lactonohydrolase-like protein n=1 Tax=Roridomyces roridus TaxID=1738132 RepID=A0AAD7FS10_9AGAR|nr:D-lactonohydrolase-like protein [Roridomyces roridus]